MSQAECEAEVNWICGLSSRERERERFDESCRSYLIQPFRAVWLAESCLIVGVVMCGRFCYPVYKYVSISLCTGVYTHAHIDHVAMISYHPLDDGCLCSLALLPRVAGGGAVSDCSLCLIHGPDSA